MTAMMIGIDLYKGSHTVMVINAGEAPLGKVLLASRCPAR